MTKAPKATEQKRYVVGKKNETYVDETIELNYSDAVREAERLAQEENEPYVVYELIPVAETTVAVTTKKLS